MSNSDTKLEKAIKDVVNYFNYFSYPPDAVELHKYLSLKITKSLLQSKLTEMVNKKELIESNDPKILNTRYFILNTNTIPPERIDSMIRHDRAVYSKNKLKKIKKLISILSVFPQIQLVGLSGSITMNFAAKHDDVDLFVISSNGRIWTARLICIIISTFFGLRRSRGAQKVSDQVCLNMFFDHTGLAIHKSKQNLYTGHEVLQMKPIINKQDTYNKFINANNWVFDYFPNASNTLRHSGKERSDATRISLLNKFFLSIVGIMNTGGNTIEYCAKKMQLTLINKHKTSEYITNTQLWFHPEDFEKKLRRDKII